MTSQLQDGALINLVLAGRADCFNLLVDRHLAVVKKRISTLVRNAAETDDVIQEVLLKVWLHLSTFRSESSFRTWMTQSPLMRQCNYSEANGADGSLMALPISTASLLSANRRVKRWQTVKEYKLFGMLWQPSRQSHCNLNFYPGYPALGALVMRVTHLPADYALLGLSVVASLVLLFLWTDPIVVRALGVGGAYASLLAFNFHTTGFSLVTIQTEPCAMVFSFGAFLAFCRRRLLLAGALAGAATAMRITAAAIGAAVALAIVTMLLVERPAGCANGSSALLPPRCRCGAWR